jgi:hypothetical protein
MNKWCIRWLFTHPLTKCRVQEAKPSVKNLVKQCCTEGFNSGVKRLMASTCFQQAYWPSSEGTLCAATGIYHVYVDWLLAGSDPILLAARRHKRKTYTNFCIYRIVSPADKQYGCSKHVEVINRNKLISYSASCWYYYTDIFLRFPFRAVQFNYYDLNQQMHTTVLHLY